MSYLCSLRFESRFCVNVCADPVGAFAVLTYWILVRVIERSPELTVNDFPGVQELARAMKNLWYAIEPTLFTLKVHCFVDHALLEDIYDVGTPYHWTASAFESMHRRLQLRVAQCTTNVEDAVVENFVMRKYLLGKLEKETQRYSNVFMDRLYAKFAAGETFRPSPGDCILDSDCHVPQSSMLRLDDLFIEHQQYFETRRHLTSF
ncbi:hypothetical protein OSTOST_17321, partial [Ostertagia ostertagi]